MANAFRQSITLLIRSGVTINAVDIAELLKKLDEANGVEQLYEGSRFHEPRLKEFGDRLDQPLASLIRNGLKIPAERYNEAKRFITDCRVRFAGFSSLPQ